MASSAQASTTILADSSSTSTSGIEYDVFLSFRGTDTLIEITDSLYKRLVDVGILVYKYDNEPHFEEQLLPEVKEAIKWSRILIAILSIDYASHKTCLNELVQMWECRILKGKTIIPLFYGISRSDVRDQAGDFGEAFDLHKTAGVDSKTITTWKEVLREIGGLPDGYIGTLYRGIEDQLVEDVVARVAQMLLDDGLAATDKLVGQVLEMTRNLGVADTEGQAIEVPGEHVYIWGTEILPDVRKIALAKVVFNKIYDLFDICSFLLGISSKGVQFSQRMLIADLQIEKPAPLESSGKGIQEIASPCHNAKVLIVLDDVGEDEQIKALAESSSSLSEMEYDLYLSFRGEDANEFVSHLYTELDGAGIRVFRDSEELRKGEEIGRKLKEEIKRSRICIPILSRNYASSRQCLMELVQMWECRELNGQTVIPIFYDVCPFDVRHQAGDFERSLNLHEKVGVDLNTIKAWKKVLRQIGRIKGWIADQLIGREGGLVKKVVAHVVQLLKKYDQVVTDKLVGIDLHVQEMMKKLGVAYSEGQAIAVCGEEVRVVGIWGVPGVGKTTLAKVVFNKMHGLFDACSFLEGISSEGIQFPQQMLIADLLKIKPPPLKSFGEGIEIMAGLCSSRKVLIVLDDVCEDEQIKALAGKLTWFGPGSRIIVTTNKRELLSAFDVGTDYYGTVEEHKVESMRDEHALQLFRNHAFQGDPPEDVSEYDSLCKDIVKAIGGLPSDIERHASIFRQRYEYK